MKQCKTCKLEKELDKFYSNSKGGYQGNCKDCSNALTRAKYRENDTFRIAKNKQSAQWVRDNHERCKEYRRDWARETIAGIYSRIVRSNRGKGSSEVISKEDFAEWYEAAIKACSYCGITEKDYLLNKEFFRLTKRLCIDCIDAKIGYVKGNLALCCYRCNTIKSDCFSYTEMKEIGKTYITSKIRRS